MNALMDEVRERFGGGTVDAALDRKVDELLRLAGCSGWPVDLERVAAKLGVVAVESKPIACDGMLIPVNKHQYRIVLANWVSASRRRFSLAHELGHAMVHQAVPETRGFASRKIWMPEGHTIEERLCDMIAARLLMPAPRMHQLAAGLGFGLDYVQLLGRLAGASVTAAARRASEVFRIDISLSIIFNRPTDGKTIVDRVLVRERRAHGRIAAGGVLRAGRVLHEAASSRRTARTLGWIPLGPNRWARRRIDCAAWALRPEAERGVLLAIAGTASEPRDEWTHHSNFSCAPTDLGCSHTEGIGTQRT